MLCKTLRLEPNSDLILKLQDVQKSWEGGKNGFFILSCVGSLTGLTIRTAYSSGSGERIEVVYEHVEIISINGSVDKNSVPHIHGSFGKTDGSVIGGHIMSNSPALVFTTVELFLGSNPDEIYEREFDKHTGYNELKVIPK